MEAQLKAIVERVEKSKLSDEQKVKIYTLISEGLESMVMPILIKYMPKDQLEGLSKEPGKVTIEAYAKLIGDTITDGQALTEIDLWMKQMVSEVDKALQEQGI